jgi:hypothetical protein
MPGLSSISAGTSKAINAIPLQLEVLLQLEGQKDLNFFSPCPALLPQYCIDPLVLATTRIPV